MDSPGTWLTVAIFSIIMFGTGFMVGWLVCASKHPEVYPTGYVLKITGGKGRGQVRNITGVTLDEPFHSPDDGSEYAIYFSHIHNQGLDKTDDVW